MIRHAHPLRFDRVAESGRTEPLRVAVETADGVEHDVIMKASANRETTVESLANEMLGSLLASDLGLPVTEPLFIDLDAAFIAAIAHDHIRDRLQQSSSVAFASVVAGQQWRRWMSSDKLIADQIGMALGIVGFDAFVANSDRSPNNPNLLVRDLEWRLIDHEGAFGFRMKLFPPCQPWVLGNLDLIKLYGQPCEHVFARQLIGRDDLDFSEVRARWSGLSDARLAQYDATLPEEWAAVRPNLAEALDHIRKVRDSIDLCIDELKRVLS